MSSLSEEDQVLLSAIHTLMLEYGVKRGRLPSDIGSQTIMLYMDQGRVKRHHHRNTEFLAFLEEVDTDRRGQGCDEYGTQEMTPQRKVHAEEFKSPLDPLWSAEAITLEKIEGEPFHNFVLPIGLDPLSEELDSIPVDHLK